MRAGRLAVVLLLLVPAHASAEWQVRPFIGYTFGGSTTFVDPEGSIATKNVIFGGTGGWLGEIFGLEVDFGRAPGFFQLEDPAEELVISSAITTLTGNVVIALPRRLSGYGLRPYFSGGFGLMHVDIVGRFEVVTTNRTLPTLSLGGGMTGFLNDRVGLTWDVRRLSTLLGEGETAGNSVGRERLSLWRATMGVAVRY